MKRRYSVHLNINIGGTVASWLVPSILDWMVHVRALTMDIVLFSWARHFSPIVCLSIQVYSPIVLYSSNLPTCKLSLCPLWRTWKKKTFEVICCLYKMKQSHWLLCIAKNCDWSRIMMPLSNLTQMASRGMNLQWKQNWIAKSTNLKEISEKIRAVFQSSPVSLKAWMLSCILQEGIRFKF